MPLFDGITDQRVLRLQVQDVELVDTRRHQQEGLLEYLGGQRLVFEQLEPGVLEHHRALAGGNILADLKLPLVGHRYMALADVSQQVLQAPGNTLALGLYGLLLGVDIESQEIAGCRRRHPLLDGEAHPGAGFLVCLHGVCQAQHGARVQQVSRRHEGRRRIAAPGLAGEAFVRHQCLAL